MNDLSLEAFEKEARHRRDNQSMPTPDPVLLPENTAQADLIALPAKQLLDTLQELNFLHLLYFWSVARDGSIVGACERLNVSQPTISTQIRKLEKSLGHNLFDRSGRSLALTEIGLTVFEYADEIFSLGSEMLGTLRGLPGKRSGRLHVGVPNYLPKLITYRLLQPVLDMPQRVQLVCHEAELTELIDGLANHRFDVILTDTPVNAPSVRVFSHPLGKCGVAVCGVSTLAARFRKRFPESLDGAPFVLPTAVTEMRRSIDRWFDKQGYSARVIAECDDSALMKEFATGGIGLTTIPIAVFTEVERQYRFELVGRLPGVSVRYFVVTSERKLIHPATRVIDHTAKSGLLNDPGD